MSTFPTIIDSFTTHVDGDVIEAADINAIQTAVVACETLLGITGSAVTGSVTYKLSNITGGDKAIGAAQAVTLTNKTLGTGTIIALGSDVTGDTYYNGGGGALTRLAVGTVGQVLTLAGGVPTWATPATLTDASYSAFGIVKGLTSAAVSGLVISSGVISVNSGVSANNIVKLDASAKLPAVDGSALTNITGANVSSILGVWSSPITQNISYQAPTDGFVVVVATVSSISTQGSIIIFSDSNPTPTTARGVIFAWAAPSGAGSAMTPVKKGDYVLVGNYTGSATVSTTIYWIPLGS